MQTKMIDIITADVERVLRLRAEDLFDLKLEYGIAYLHRRFELDTDIATALQNHPKFWLWWRELWAERDRKLLAMCEPHEFYLRYVYPVGKEVTLESGDSFQHKGVTGIMWDEVWDFYSKYHRPEKIPFYPNYVLVSECLGSPPPSKVFSNFLTFK